MQVPKKSHALRLLGLLATASSLSAITFSSGDLGGSFDTTVSVGGIYRLNDPAPDLYGTSNGGNANSVNSDDGNLNFEKGWVSKAFKVTSDLAHIFHRGKQTVPKWRSGSDARAIFSIQTAGTAYS